MEIRSLIDEFIDDLRGMGRSVRTVRGYRFDLNQFAGFMEDSGLPATLENIDERTIRQFMTWLVDQDNKPNTVCRKFMAVRSFLRFCQDYEYGYFPKIWRIKPPRKQENVPNYLNPAEIDLFLSTPIKPYAGVTFGIDRELRDELAFKVLAWTGIRQGELLALNVGDVDLLTGSLTVTGKGDKQRVIPLRSELREALARYIDGEDDPDRPLFLSSTGKRWRPGAFWYAVHRHATQCGLENVSPHTFRHSFATHLIRQNVDVKTTQELLGHANINTTMIYVHTDPNRTRGAVEKLPF